MNGTRRKIVLSAILIILVSAIGTIGYMVIEGWKTPPIVWYIFVTIAETFQSRTKLIRIVILLILFVL